MNAHRLLQCLLLTLLLFAGAGHAAVSFPNGDWREESIEEYRVKVVGGWVRVQRDYVFDKWQTNARWNPLSFEKDLLDDSVKRITRNEAVFEKQGDAYAFGKRALIRAQNVLRLPPGSVQGSAPGDLTASASSTAGGGLVLDTVAGYRWNNRDGQWVDYDGEGKIVAYGDKNDLRVWLDYGTAGSANAGRIVAVRDHFGRTVLTYSYDASGQISQVIEADPASGSSTPTASFTPRRLQLTWNAGLLTQATDVLGHTTLHTYDSSTPPKLKTVTDPEGRILAIDYGPTGRVSKVTAPDGGVTSYQYDYDKLKRVFYLRQDGPTVAAGIPVLELWFDADGREIRRDVNGATQSKLLQDSANRSQTTTDARGLVTVVTLDEFDNPVRTQYPDGSDTRARYSVIHGGLLETTDELGIKTTYDYDARGNPTRVTEAVGTTEQRITETSYDGHGQALTVTRKGGNVTLPNSSVPIADATLQTQWDTRGNPVQLTNETGAVLQSSYDPGGRPQTLTDPNGKAWTTAWDGKGQLKTLADPLGHTLTHSYDKADNRIQTQDGAGRSTTYGYDPANRLTRIANALNQAQTVAYDKQGRLTARNDETNTPLQTLAYDLNGRLTQDTDGNGNLTAYRYPDSAPTSGLPSRIDTPTFSRTLTWDARERNTRTQDQLDATTAYTSTQAYDKRGSPIQITDRNGKITILGYDSLGRLATVTDPMSGITRYTYDSWDRLIAVTDPKGNTTTYGYDPAGRRTRETRPLGATQTWSYDQAGNLTRTTDAKGNLIVYGYDDARRRISETHTPAGSPTPSRSITYSYNAANALTGFSDSQSTAQGPLTLTHAYTLDELHRKTSETVTLADTSGSRSYTTQTGYTVTGQLGRFTWPDSTQANYSYDANQNATGITLPEGSLSTPTQRWNQPTRIQLPGGTGIDQSYDALMRPIQTQAKANGGATLLTRSLGYDPESNILQKDTEFGSHGYQYDNLYRLTIATNPTLANEAYSYDAVGNRLTDKLTDGVFSTNTWTYDQDNKLTLGYTRNAAPITYTWDENGSLTRKTSNDIGDGTTNQRYLYDAANRLTEVQDGNGSPIARYAYDPYGRRIRKTLIQQGGQVLATPKTIDYLYSDQGLIAEAEQGTITRRYGWRPDRPWGTDPVLLSTRRTGADPASALETFYFLNDHLGTPQKMIDLGGNSVWEGRALAFGEAQVQAGNLVENNLRLPGQYYDQETNTHQNYFRDYDPRIGRYPQADPIGLAGGVNRHSYVRSNPLRYADPLGLWSTEAHDYFIDKLGYMPYQSAWMKEGSAYADSSKFQDGAHSYMHAMSSSILNKEEALKKYCQFLNNKLAYFNDNRLSNDPKVRHSAYFNLGMGLHAIMDSTSPVHRGFQLWEKENFYEHGPLPSSKEGMAAARIAESETLRYMEAAIRGKSMPECGCR